MKISVLGSTNSGYSISQHDALVMAGREAGICYMPDTLNSILDEPEDKSIKRAQNAITNGHHSITDHIHYNFAFENIPKILAMVLNNEKVYDTSEKSARYTTMQTSGLEKELYERWQGIFFDRIRELYPNISDKDTHKLALENARYLISIFTPATTMGYTVSLRQINYILNWMQDEIDVPTDDPLRLNLKPILQEFHAYMTPIVGVDGLVDNKGRSLSLFAKRWRKEEFGENYCTNYMASFACLAQLQRHRTLNFEIIEVTDRYFVPDCISGTTLEEDWLRDISSLSERYPQGCIVWINERGPIENLVAKSRERLCGRAFLETCAHSKDVLDDTFRHLKEGTEVRDYLEPYTKGARCTFEDFVCQEPCRWGASQSFTRRV